MWYAEHLPPGFPPDLPAPEALSLADAKDAEALIEALGEYTVRALFSKTWQLREAALMSIEKVLQGEGGGVEDSHKGDVFKSLSKALLKSVQDKVANVFHGTLQVDQCQLCCPGDCVAAKLPSWHRLWSNVVLCSYVYHVMSCVLSLGPSQTCSGLTR